MPSKFLQTLILALAALALASSPARGQGDTTSFSYDFSTGQSPSSLSLDGDAHYVLRMTTTDPKGNALPNTKSKIVHADPIRFVNAGGRAADFKTTFKYFIRPNPGDDNPGNGFFFLIDEAGKSSSSSSSSSAAVLVAEFDPRDRHIGIHVGSGVSNRTEVDDFSFYGEEVTATVEYNGETKVLRSTATAAGGRKHDVTVEWDLGAFAPPIVQVGITASTGGQVAVHELSSWDFTCTLPRDAAAFRQYA